MEVDLKSYREVPLGEQLSEHFKNRAELRRDIPLFSFSFSKLAKRFEADSSDASDEGLQRV